MEKDISQSESIDLSFAMEASSSLWNLIFEGFDQEVTLVSKFVGNDPGAVNKLYKFADILSKRYKDCRVEVKDRGIVIKKLLPENDLSLVNQWTDLMQSMRREMSDFGPK
jgi:hypothetical protein